MANENFGENVDDYVVYEMLGRGAFAAVYRAVCRHNNQQVAIKMINKTQMHNANMVDRVRQEVKIHSRLKHPSILELYTFFEDADYVYLVLEWGENGELQRYLKQVRKTLTEREAASIIGQVSEGLIYLHNHKILHRDMSLSNLLLTKDMQVKIADFGLAVQLNQPDETRLTLCGTPNYISPEVASRSPHGLSADLWGLGCMLYTLLVGKGPFDTRDVKTTLGRVREGNYEMPEHISMEAKDLLFRLLQKNPSHRITLTDVLQHPFVKGNSVVCRTTTDSGILTMSSGKDLSSRAPLQVLKHFRSEELINTPPLQHMALNRIKSDSVTELANRVERVQVFGSQGSLKQISLMSGQGSGFNRNYNSIESPIPQFQQNHQQPQQSKLSTLRLHPMRHKTKNAILTLTDSGEVVLEFLKFSHRFNSDRIVEVVKVDGTGDRISIFKPKDGNGMEILETPISISQDLDGVFKSYNHSHLPQKYWRRYVYAARFVDMVKAKTPKVTYYSDVAKCQLMESLEDFEMQFYDGGMISLMKGTDIKIVDNLRRTTMIKQEDSCPRLNEITREMFTFYKESLNNVYSIEKTLNSLDPIKMFPSIIGRRPNSSSRIQQFQVDPNVLTPPRTPNLQIPSFAMSSATTTSVPAFGQLYNNNQFEGFTPDSPTPYRQEGFSTPVTSKPNYYHPPNLRFQMRP